MRSYTKVGEKVREIKEAVVILTVACDGCGYSPPDGEDYEVTETWVVFDANGCGQERLERDLCMDCCQDFMRVVNEYFKLPENADWYRDRMAREEAQNG
jgi:hypothetical protein